MSGIKHMNWEDIPAKRKAEHENYQFDRRKFLGFGEATNTWVSVYEIPPGKSAYPYHYHHKNEETFFILRGQGLLKTPEGERTVRAGDLLFFPANSDGAHKLTNLSDTEDLVYLDFDVVHDLDVAVYPETGKLGVWGKNINRIWRQQDDVDYYDGEYTMSRQWNALGVSHRFIRQHLPKGGFAIDATAGNGGDTLMLCETVGPEGRVLAMDIQPQAVENTQKLLAENGWAPIVRVVQDSHACMDQYAAAESADCVVFNFGWLPGGDHNIFTRKESSLEAIEKGLSCLKPGGIMSLCVYYGRNNGYEERDAILEYVRGLDHRQYTVLVVDFANRINDPPIPIFIVKEG